MPEPTIPQPRKTVEEIDRAIDLLREAICTCEDHGGDAHRLRSEIDRLTDERHAARTGQP